jgi:predicted PurR-regulated permease PerM
LSVAKTIALTAAVLLGLAFLALTAQVLLLIFAGILLGILLRWIADAIDATIKCGPAWGLALALLGILSLFAGGIWVLFPDIVTQGGELLEQLPRGLQGLQERLRETFGGVSVFDYAFDHMTSPSRGTIQGLIGGAFGVVSGTLGVLGSIIVVFFTGLYLAIDPETYRAGMIRLIPPRRRERASRIVDQVREVLLWWMIGKLISMALVGGLIYLGLWALGMPLALSLALIAALLTFIPNFGPIIAAVPAVLIAMNDGLTQTALVLSLYVAVEVIESYLLTPLIQQRTVSLPPVLTLSMQLVAAVLVGMLGLALATPLTAAGLVLIREIYVKDILEREA